MAGIEIKEIKSAPSAKVAFIEEMIPAGFPSPAQGITGDVLDLNRELIHNPSATFCATVTGDSMTGYGIDDGDLLIIDKSLPTTDGSIAVCYMDGDFTVKRIAITKDGVYLEPGNPAYPRIRVANEGNFQIWGIVSHIIKRVTPH